MRQSHQKSRSRGRSRKPQNLLSRNYESNGPDVKIRGNAGHIAEKYSTLARDALSNGDTIMAENYFQHAEHFNRLIAVAQAQRNEENASYANGKGPQPEMDDNVRAEDRPATENEEMPDVPVPVQAAEEKSDDASSEPKEHKANRNRRTKRVAAETVNEADCWEDEKPAPVSNGSKAKPLSSKKPVTDDSASLPQSITGDIRAEDA